MMTTLALAVHIAAAQPGVTLGREGEAPAEPPRGAKGYSARWGEWGNDPDTPVEVKKK